MTLNIWDFGWRCSSIHFWLLFLICFSWSSGPHWRWSWIKEKASLRATPWTNIQQAHYIATRNSGERDFATCAFILAGHVAGKRRTQNLPPNHVVPISMLSHVLRIKVAHLAQSTSPYVLTHRAGYISGWEWVRTRQRSKYKLFVDWFSPGLCSPKWVWSSFPIIYRICPQRVIYLFFL